MGTPALDAHTGLGVTVTHGHSWYPARAQQALPDGPEVDKGGELGVFSGHVQATHSTAAAVSRGLTSGVSAAVQPSL